MKLSLDSINTDITLNVQDIVKFMYSKYLTGKLKVLYSKNLKLAKNKVSEL